MHDQRSKVESSGRKSRGHAQAPPARLPVLYSPSRRSDRPGQLGDTVPFRIWAEHGALFSRKGPLAVRPPRFLADLSPQPLGPLTRAQLVAHPHWITQLSLYCPLVLAGPVANGSFVLVSGWDTWAVLTELGAASIPRVPLYAWRIQCSATSAVEHAAWMTGLVTGRHPAVPRGVLARAISPYLRPSRGRGNQGQVSLAADLVGVTRQALPKPVSAARTPRPKRDQSWARPRRSKQLEGRHTEPRRGRRP